MSDAVSSIQLGVGTDDALTHLTNLRNAFAGLRSEMEQFNATKSSLETLTGDAASTTTAMDKLTAELEKAKSEASGLRTLVENLAKANRELAAATEAAGAAQAASAGDVTKAVTQAAATQSRVVTESLTKQVEETRAAEQAIGNAVEETTRRIKKSQSERQGRTTISISEPATQAEFDAAAAQRVQTEAQVLYEKQLRLGEAMSAAIAQRAEYEYEITERRKQAEQDLFNRQMAHGEAMSAAIAKRAEYEYEITERRKKQEQDLFEQQMAHGEAMAAAIAKRAEYEYTITEKRKRDAQALFEQQVAHGEAMAAAIAKQAEREYEITERRRKDALKQIEEQDTIQAKRNQALHDEWNRLDMLDAKYDQMNAKAKLSIARLASSYVNRGGTDAPERFGGAVMADANPAGIARLEAEVQKLTGSTQRNSAATRSNAEAHREAAAAMAEAHAMVRGLAGGLNMLWTTWGSFVPLVAGAAITASLSEIYKAGKDVEYQLQFVKALSGEAVDFDKFLRVSDGSLSSLKDAAAGMRALSQAGLNASQAIMALPTVLNLAAVGEMSVAQAALAATGVVNAFNLSIGDMDRVGDIFAKVAATTNTSVIGMTEAMKQASTVGAMFKVSIEEAAASIGILAKRNIEGSSAGTSLTNALKGLYEPTDQAKEAMKRLGIEVKTQDGTLKPYSQLLTELATKLSGLNEQGQLNFLGTITDQRGAKTISAIVADLGAYKKALKEAEDATGFMGQAVSVLDDTVTGSARRMSNAFEGSFVKAFQSAEPAIRGVLDRLADIGKSQQFVDMVDRLARGAVSLTTFLLDHAKALGIVAAAYVGLRVISSATSALVAYQVAAISAARASAAAAVGATELSAASTVAATGVGRLAAALRLASASAGWLSLIGGLLFTAYELFAGGADKATLAEQKHQNSLKTTIDFLDREIDRLKQRNQLLDENLFRDFGVGDGQPPEKKTVQTQLDKEKAHLTELEAKRNQLQSDIADAERKAVAASGPQVAKEVTRLNELKATLKGVQAQVDETSASLKKIDQDLQEIDKLSATGNQKNSQYNLLRKATDLQHQMGGGGVEYESRGNATTHSLLPGFEQFIARVKEGKGDIKALESEFNDWYRTVNKSLADFDKLDKSHENALMRAELAKLQGSQDRFAQTVKNQGNQDKEANRQGELGDLELQNRELQRQMELQLVILDVSKGKVDVLKKHKDQEGAIQTEVEKQKKAIEQYNDLQVTAAEKTATMMEKYTEESLRVEAASYRDQGRLVDAFLAENERKYKGSRAKIESDLEAIRTGKVQATPEQVNTLQRRANAMDTEFKSGLNKAQFAETKNGFDAMYADMEAKLEALNTRATNAGNVGAMVRAAEQSDAIRNNLIPALQDAQQEMLRLAKESGNKQAEKEAINYGKNLAHEAEKAAAQWLIAGKAIERSLESAFGKGGKAAGGMLVAYMQYANQKKAIDEKLEKAKGEADPVKREKAITEAMRESTEAQLNNYANMAGAAKGFFDEHSNGYKILLAAERAFRVMELAMAAESFIRKTFFATATATAQVGAITTATTANAASVAPNVAADSAKASSSGVVAVAKAIASLPFPFNIAAGAATIAALVAVGVKVAGAISGGPSSRDPAKDLQDRAGTQAQGRTGALDNLKKSGPNGYFDWELVKSESIDKSLQLLKDNSNIALRHTSGMLSALQSIRDNIGGMAKAIATTAGLRGTYADQFGQGFGDKRSFLGFSKSSKELKDSGLEIAGGQTLQQIIAQGIEAYKYQTIEEKSSSFWGLFKSDKTYTNRQDADSGLKSEMAKTLVQMSKTVQASATYLNPGSGEAIQQVLDQFEVNIGKMSFKGLKPDEIKEQLEATFSRVGDDMAKAVMPGVEAFTRAGEGTYETLIRVSTGVEQARFALSKLGIAAVDVVNVADKAGDIGGGIVKASIEARESQWVKGPGSFYSVFSSTMTRELTNVGKIIDQMTGSAEDLVKAYQQLVDVRTSMKMTGLNPEGLTQDAVYGAGGLDALQSGMNDYLSGVFSEVAQKQISLQKLNDQFAELGLHLPKTKDEFKSLVSGIDLTTVSGQKLFGQLMALSGSFVKVTDDVEAANKVLAEIQRSLRMTGLNPAGASDVAATAAGGLDKLQSGVDDYLSGLFTEVEQKGFAIQKLRDQFAMLGLQMPKSNDDFKKLVNGLDLTSDSGQKLFGKLMTLAGAFAKVTEDTGTTSAALARLRSNITATTYKEDTTTFVQYATRWKEVKDNALDMFESVDKAIYDLKKSAYDQYGTMDLSDDQKAAKAALQADMKNMAAAQALRMEQKANLLWAQLNAPGLTPEQQLDVAGKLKDTILARYEMEQENSKKLLETAKQLKGYLQDLLTGDLSPLTSGGKLDAAKSSYESTLAAAQGGDETAMGELQNKAQTYLESARTFYASSDAYKAIFNAVSTDLGNFAANANAQGAAQMSDAERQIAELDQVQTAMDKLAQEASKTYDNAVSQLAAALAMQQAMEATLGVVSTLPQILADLPAGLVAQLAAQGVINKSPLGVTPEPLTASVIPMAQEEAKPTPLSALLPPVIAATPTPLSSQDATGGLPSFFSLNFGSHAKGLDYVPYDGYRAELHKGERVLTAAATSRMDAGQAELLAEVSALRAEVAALRNDQRQQTGDLIRSNFESSDMAAEKIVDGHKEAADNAVWKQSSAATLK